MRGILTQSLVCLSLGCMSSLVLSADLSFSRTDLTDVVPGEDLWQNSYTFTGGLEAFGGLTLIFSSAQYGMLDVPMAPAELSALSFQPDAGLGFDGLVTFTALANQSTGYIANFVVTYVKLGSLSDSHPFEVFDGGFNIVSNGVANMALVPEPASALLLGGGALALLALRRRHRPTTPAL